MGLMAEWSGMRFEVEPGNVRPIGSLSGTRSVSVERNEDKEGEPATQVVSLDLMTLDVEYTVARAATGEDPRSVCGQWWHLVGTYAPFYVCGSAFMAELFLLKSVSYSDILQGPDGRFESVKIALSFEEYAEDESGLKAESTAYRLSPGVMTASPASTAVGVGPTDAQRAGKMPSNPGM